MSRADAHASTHGVLSKLLHLLVIAVLKGDETLCNLEEVRVWLIRGEVNIEDKGAIGGNVLLSWQHLEWVLDEGLRGLVEHGQEGPIDRDWEAELVLKGQLTRLAQTTILREVEVDRLLG